MFFYLVHHLPSHYEVKTRVNKVVEKTEMNKIIGIFTKYFLENEEVFNPEAFAEIVSFLIEEL